MTPLLALILVGSLLFFILAVLILRQPDTDFDYDYCQSTLATDYQEQPIQEYDQTPVTDSSSTE